MPENVFGQDGLQLQTLVTFGNDYRLTRAFWIASLAITLYDFLLTLGDEVTFVWRGRLTRTHVLFWLNRLWPISCLLINNICESLRAPLLRYTTYKRMLQFWHWNILQIECFGFFNWFVYSPFVTHFTIGSILILRIYAMYDRNKTILIALVLLFAGELISEMIVVGFITVHLQEAHLPLPLIGCVPRHIVDWVWVYWLPMSIFESCLFLLAVAKAIQLTYHGYGRAPNLLMILLRDSVIYFGGILSVILTNFVVWNVGRTSLFATFLSTVFAIHSILGCRMLLNIQRAAYTEAQEEIAMFTTLDSGPHLVLAHKPAQALGDHELFTIQTVDPT